MARFEISVLLAEQKLDQRLGLIFLGTHGERRRCEHTCKETLNANLADKLLDIWSDSERHIELNLLLSQRSLWVHLYSVWLTGNGLDWNAEYLLFDLIEVELSAITCGLHNFFVEVQGVAQISLLHIDTACCFAETKRAQILLVGQIEHIGEERIDCMVLRKLLLEYEHIVHI